MVDFFGMNIGELFKPSDFMVEIFDNLSQLPYTRQNNTLKQGV
jgi:hypothetical protein